MSALPKHTLASAEYLVLERAAKRKSEFPPAEPLPTDPLGMQQGHARG